MEELNEVMNSYNEYTQNIPKGLLVIINQLRDNEVEEALVNIKNFSEGIMWLIEATHLINKNKGNLKTDITELIECLTEINKSLEKEDYMLTADIFEYDLIPFFTKLKNESLS